MDAREMVDNPEAMQEHNSRNIDEFRANGGRIAAFGDDPLLILHSTGAKSGRERLNPMAYQPVGDGWAVFASRAGTARHPDWYYNLKAHPDALIEVGSDGGIDTIKVTARELIGSERDEIWERQKQLAPGFAAYETQTEGRVIPVLLLTKTDG
ncbi:nitroreductase/quinone reductase family protein [Mycobacterium sp. Marseille-P9652]|uniref:nitroreductase/quinone reductase family protein n=1 Tax=Mycobacterium sp. Marseille-P9652 TaxID=2654950 RepID=UPI001E2D80A0|nr:nitroreductase/quinone reductase family protein [Mycobacterium sp. Marseille-P9652]